MSNSAAPVSVGFRSEKGPILIAIMVTTGLVAIDSTILATAVHSITQDIGGFAAFPWLFSIYLLAQAVSVPIYAKLSDVVGRKPIVLVGIGLFLVGSILCGFAWSMPALIAFRALQGLGAGAVQPMAITIAGDIYTVRERAKAQGYIASVWAIASVVGPALGGVFSQLGIWRGIFFVNVPLCILAIVLLVRNFDEKIERTKHRIDYPGAILLTVSLSLIIVGVLEGDVAWAWDSWQSIGSFAVGGLLLLAFVLFERRAPEPVLPLNLFSRRLILTTTLISLGAGGILIGLTSYVPTYLQGALGVDPLIAGLALAALTIGWPLAASQVGRVYLRIGFRNTAIIGVAIVILGTGALVLVGHSPEIFLVAVICFVIGLGMGLSVPPSLIAAQSSVDWNERGVVTGTNLFARNIGSAVGVAIFGAIANGIFASNPRGEKDIPTLENGSTSVFLAVLVVAVATIVAAITMPRGDRPAPSGIPPEAAAEASAG